MNEWPYVGFHYRGAYGLIPTDIVAPWWEATFLSSVGRDSSSTAEGQEQMVGLTYQRLMSWQVNIK